MKANKIQYLTHLVVLIMLPIISSGQPFKLGIHFGLNLSQYSNWKKYQEGADPAVDLTNPENGGFLAGFVAEKPFSDYLGLQAELNFEQKGFTLKSETQKLTSNINYLTLPILLKGGYDISFIRLNVVIGPYFGIALNGKVKSYSNETLKSTQKIEFGSGILSDYENDAVAGGPKGFKANRFEIGLLAGLQPAITLGPGLVFLDIRFAWGFIGIDHPTKYQKYYWGEISNGEAYYSQCNRTWSIAAGYILPLSGIFGK